MNVVEGANMSNLISSYWKFLMKLIMENSFTMTLVQFLNFPQRIEANSENALILKETQDVEDNESSCST